MPLDQTRLALVFTILSCMRLSGQALSLVTCRSMCSSNAQQGSSMDSIWTAGARKAAAEPEAPMITTVSPYLVT